MSSPVPFSKTRSTVRKKSVYASLLLLTLGQAVAADIVRVAEYTAVKAYNPQPANGAAGVTLALLQWNAGPSAVWQEVYFGTDPNLGAAEHVASQTYLKPVYYHPPGLTPGTTYYWRIDSIDAQGTVYTGDVWSFTAMPATAWTPSPVNGAAYVATDIVLGWSAGVNATTHDVYLSTDRAAVESGAAAAKKADKQAGTSYTAAGLERGRTYFARGRECPGHDGARPRLVLRCSPHHRQGRSHAGRLVEDERREVRRGGRLLGL